MQAARKEKKAHGSTTSQSSSRGGSVGIVHPGGSGGPNLKFRNGRM